MKNISIDIGGTSIKCAIIDGGEIIRYDRVSTRAKEGKEAIIESIFDAVAKMMPYADKDCGIAIGCAGDIDCDRGKIIFATGNLPNFTGLELAELVAKQFKKQVTLINDANAGALAECNYGAGKGHKIVLMITLGTGLGGSLITDGKQYLGTKYRGMRLGHVTFKQDGRACNCGKVGCIEQYLSATGLINTARECGLKCGESGEIFKLANKGNIKANRAVNLFLSHATSYIHSLFDIFDPSVLVIGGGLIELKEYWLDALKERLVGFADRIVPATLGNKAGVIGANSYLMSKQSQTL